MALVASAATNISSDHLKSCGSGALDYAKTILAITALNQNPATFGNVNYVGQLKNFYQAGQIGDPAMLMDDSFGILALSAAGLAPSTIEINETKNYLISKQNSDGGWGYNVGLESDTNSTAIIVISLVEAGLSPSDSVIDNALGYLGSAQNSDGGWGWAKGNNSDTDSTSWVVWAIRKVSQSPALWQKGNNNPISFITSLKNSDGSFGRTASSPTGNLMATQDAVIALSEKTLPLAHFSASSSDQDQGNSQAGQYLLRIEGPSGAICNKYLDGTTAYDLLVAGQSVCNYTFTGNRDWGTFFLDSINGINNNFPAYWMYLIDNQTTSDGLEQYNLKAGDQVLIYYDPDTNAPAFPDYDRPLRISASKIDPEPNETITVTVEAYNNGWQPLADATVFGADKDYQTNSQGQATLALGAGYYTIYAEKSQYIRSNQQVIMVGDGVSQGVGLQIEIDQGGRGRIEGESIIFEITPSQLNFGKVRPGQAATQNVTLNNGGTVNLTITAALSGDSVFTNNLKIDSANWQTYSHDLSAGDNTQEEVSLTVPTSYIGSGIKTGELIFWAQTQ
jgi:hypothetical protein